LFTNVLHPTHLLITLIVALLFLGPKRLPEAGHALGKGIKELHNSISGEPSDDQIAPAPPSPTKETPKVSSAIVTLWRLRPRNSQQRRAHHSPPTNVPPILTTNRYDPTACRTAKRPTIGAVSRLRGSPRTAALRKVQPRFDIC
jgi:sec-independent protein translocase protein TatA